MEIASKFAPLALAVIMLGLGLNLRTQDFVRVAKIPKDFLVGSVSQIIILPVVALSTALILNLPAEIAIGLMLIACAPGGVTSNVLTKFADGDVALSITLTAIISLVSIFTVPFIMFASIDFFDIEIMKKISVASIALKMFFVVTIPVMIGMIIKYFAKDFVAKQKVLIQRTSIMLFILVYIAIWVQEWDNLILYFVEAGMAALILNLSMMIIGFYLAKLFASGVAQQRCISLECGLQNGTLALVVGTQIFGKDVALYILPGAAYALIMMATSIIFIFIIKRNIKKI